MRFWMVMWMWWFIKYLSINIWEVWCILVIWWFLILEMMGGGLLVVCGWCMYGEVFILFKVLVLG